jgi:predicted PolB exonuclease-like 3'-5' exonuclease
MPTNYTPELIAELNKLAANLPRAEGVKAVGKKLGLSARAARQAYAQYVKVKGVPLTERDAKAIEATKVPFKPRKIRRLFWDIETSPNIGLFWRAGWKLNIDCDNIIKERAIICIGWKWEDEKEAHILHWDDNQDDKTMLAAFLKVANEADEMVHHNGDKFDLPWFKTRCLFHGLIPLPEYKCADTLQWARRKFYFNSNKLNYIAQFLGMGAKLKTEFGLWKDILLKKCPKAMAKMCKYCKRDVILLEKVWQKLSQCANHKTHAGVLMGGDKWMSPRDGNTNVKLNKTRVTANGTKQYQMQDLVNGTYFTIGEAAYRAYLKAKQSV